MKRLADAGLIAVACLLVLQQAAGASDFRFSPRQNSAELVHWRTWGPETFAEARSGRKPVLLSLSAVWCHWCHVMDETTYSDPDVIEMLNERFIPVRVDADLRPDLDSLYNQGGWPSTVFLSADGEVIFGGNYFPPEEMKLHLAEVLALFASGRTESRIKAFRARKAEDRQPASRPRSEDSVLKIMETAKNSFDEEHGGFGSGQKFPSPPTLDFLLTLWFDKRDPEIQHIITTTLDHMAQGDIRDRAGGGFFRYATRPDWSSPHYEKMLDVNAGMIKNYAEAGRVFGRKSYRKIAEETIGYVDRNLFDSKTGALYGSQDADEAYYALRDRARQKAPAVDKTVYADSSALMVSALASASLCLNGPLYLAQAQKGMDFLLAHLYSADPGVFHYERDGKRGLPGQLLDNALVGSALLDLYNLTGERRYRTIATDLGRLILDRFYDPGEHVFKSNTGTAGTDPVTAGIMAVVFEQTSNFRALQFLARLYRLNREERTKQTLDAVFQTFAGTYDRHAALAASYGNAVLWLKQEPVEITILLAGKNKEAWMRAVNGVFLPLRIVRVLSVTQDGPELRALNYSAREAAYICRGKQCSRPVTEPGKLRDALARFIAQGRVP
jgi:uncharacterized protein YyaL (SSP411 family)